MVKLRRIDRKAVVRTLNKDPIGEKAVKLQKEAVTPPFLYAVFR